MALQTKGLCKYCGKEYTKGGMLRHLQTCKKRSAKLAEEKGKRRCRYFQVVITGKYVNCGSKREYYAKGTGCVYP